MWPLPARAVVLPPFIIEQIRRREEREAEERSRRDGQKQPRLEIPGDSDGPASDPPEEQDNPNRGVVIVDLG